MRFSPNISSFSFQIAKTLRTSVFQVGVVVRGNGIQYEILPARFTCSRYGRRSQLNAFARWLPPMGGQAEWRQQLFLALSNDDPKASF